MNSSLHRIKVAPKTDREVYHLDVENCSPEQNLERVIIEGLNGMEPDELICTTNASGWPVENAISFNWAFSVKKRIANVHLEFQKPIQGKWIDFYLNGSIDAGLEVLRNATQTRKEGSRGQSQDIDEHLHRFLSKAYIYDRFALFNFAMDDKKEIVLPRDESYHDNVYTYHHAANALYRGNKVIRAPAVSKLPCPARIIVKSTGSGGAQRRYSIAAERLTASVLSDSHRQTLLVPTRLVLRGITKKLLR